MKRKSKNYGWPHMFYCIADGTYLVCATLADVPEGFADTRGECDVLPVGGEEPSPYMGPRPMTADETTLVEDEDEDDNEEDDNEPEADGATPPVAEAAPTLETLGITRKQGIALLTEENIDFKKNIPNARLAVLVQTLLDEDEDEGE